MFSHNGANRQNRGRRVCFVEFARWRLRGRNLPSPTALCGFVRLAIFFFAVAWVLTLEIHGGRIPGLLIRLNPSVAAPLYAAGVDHINPCRSELARTCDTGIQRGRLRADPRRRHKRHIIVADTSSIHSPGGATGADDSRLRGASTTLRTAN